LDLGAVLGLLIEEQDRRHDGDGLLASRLQLSANTVRTHLHSLMVKFGVHSTLEVAALARPWLQALPQVPEARTSA
jgi:predicted ArsR family transcriptional regulator